MNEFVFLVATLVKILKLYDLDPMNEDILGLMMMMI